MSIMRSKHFPYAIGGKIPVSDNLPGYLLAGCWGIGYIFPDTLRIAYEEEKRRALLDRLNEGGVE